MASRTSKFNCADSCLVSVSLPQFYLMHRIAFIILGCCLLSLTRLYGASFDPHDVSILTGLIILVLGVPHGAFDAAIWSATHERGFPRGLSRMLLYYVLLASGFFGLWLLVPTFALPVFLVLSIYHFSGDWDRDLEILPRLIVAAAMISAPAGLHRAQVVEIFAWLAPAETAITIGIVIAVASAPLLQASAVVVALLFVRRPLAAIELAVVLALAWLTPPLMFFLVYFCGLHSIRHLIETQDLLRARSVQEFVRSAMPYAPLAVVGTVAGSLVLTNLPPGPALITTIFMALGALTVPHLILMEFANFSRTNTLGRR